MSTKTYSEKLKDQRWQKKRLEIFNRDNWTCKCCGSTSNPLNIHHVAYGKGEIYALPGYMYQTLCEECHQQRQETTDRIVNAVRIAIKDVPTCRLIEYSKWFCGKAMLEIEVED